MVFSRMHKPDAELMIYYFKTFLKSHQDILLAVIYKVRIILSHLSQWTNQLSLYDHSSMPPLMLCIHANFSHSHPPLPLLTFFTLRRLPFSACRCNSGVKSVIQLPVIINTAKTRIEIVNSVLIFIFTILCDLFLQRCNKKTYKYLSI
jgi:hypothetical protein